MLVLSGVYAGPTEQGEAVVAPLRHLDTPDLDWTAIRPYTLVQRMSDPRYPSGDLYYWKSRYLSRLDDEVLEQIATYAGQRPSPRNFINLWHMGGAIDRIDPTTSTFSHRHQPYLLEIAANWKDPALSEQCIGWARALWAATERFSTGAIYLIFPVSSRKGSNWSRPPMPTTIRDLSP